VTNSASAAISSSATDSFGVAIAPSIIATASGPLKMTVRFRMAGVTF
jgi:hypothetical protein